MILSLMGLYNYDQTLFDDLVLPSGIDKEVLISNLLFELAENEVIYPNVDFMRLSIGMWSKKQLESWSKMKATLDLKYNPLWNVDADITETENRNLKYTNKSSGDSVGSVVGFNEDGFKDADKNTANSQGESTDNGTISHTIRRTGNIGVTSSQQLIAEERKLAEFVMMDYIINEFKQRFCLLIY